jgi:hypothetical protein
MFFAGKALARRIEAAEAAVARECSGPAVEIFEVAGGSAIFAGPESPLTQAIGIGMDGPVSEADLGALEAFFRQRGAPVKIELSPLADQSFIHVLGARGYRITEFSNVMFRWLEGFVPSEVPRVSRVTAPDEERWSLAVGQGFFEQDQLSEDEMNIGRAILGMPGACCYLASDGGQPAGGAAMSTRNGLACLFADSTIKEFRGRGLHRELIAARLADALALNCDAVTASTAPGSISQRNYERLGFHVAYSRVSFNCTVDNHGPQRGIYNEA